MLSGIKAWFIGLSQIGKLSVISSVVLGSVFVGAVASPTPESSQSITPAAQEQTVKQPVVTTKVETESQPIAFEEQTIEDGSLAKGSTQVRTAGVEGVKTITHTITLADGVEADRKTDEVVTLAPVTQVTAVGTYVEPAALQYSAPSSSGVVKMSRTSICHAPGTTYYNQTKNYTSYDSLDACLSAGGRMPKR